MLFKPASLGRSLNPITVYTPASQRKEELVHARELFSEALKQEPNYARAAYDLAQTCDLLSDENGMFEGFRSAIRSDPSYVDARVDYAGALIESGDPDEAIRQLVEAIRLDPNATSLIRILPEPIWIRAYFRMPWRLPTKPSR